MNNESQPVPPVQPSGQTPDNKKTTQVAVVIGSIIAALVLLVGLGLLIRNMSDDSETNSADDTNSSSFLDDSDMTPYVSSEYNFTVDFPGFPATEHSTLDVEGAAVPYTQYVKETDNGSKAYMLQVATYPESDFDLTGQERGSLDGAINGSAQNSGATIVNSSNDGTFHGYPSAEATLSYAEAGTTYTMYALYFIKDNALYTLMTIGVDEDAFDAFTESFKFND